jgi:quercetin dioxygenase-like cupin family protein
MKRHLTWFAAALAAALLQPSMAGADGTVTPVYAGALPNVPGNNLTAVLVEYKPGEKTDTHYHAGSVFAYVLSGEIRSQISPDEPAKIYKAGESFFEPPGSTHLISENASTTEPASLLAVIVAPEQATLTTMGQRK